MDLTRLARLAGQRIAKMVVVILAIAISLHFLSDGIREVLDPRSRK